MTECSPTQNALQYIQYPTGIRPHLVPFLARRKFPVCHHQHMMKYEETHTDVIEPLLPWLGPTVQHCGGLSGDISACARARASRNRMPRHRARHRRTRGRQRLTVAPQVRRNLPASPEAQRMTTTLSPSQALESEPETRTR